MGIFFALLYAFGGVVWLLMGGDVLVRGAMALAARARVSPLVVGVTVVAFGTSAPELVVSIRAALLGYPELALGNVVGSNVANVLLVVGLPAMVYPMSCAHRGVSADGWVMFFASVLFVALCAAGPLGLGDGLILLAGLTLFLVRAIRTTRDDPTIATGSGEMDRILGLPSSRRMIVLFLLFGGLALPLGAELLIRGAVVLAELLEVPKSVIGLTVLAVGTSLPELATTVVAAFKREAELAVGNVLGSNSLNILAIMGVTTVVSPDPIVVPEGFLTLQLPFMLGAAAVLTWATVGGRTIGRRLGTTLCLAYVVFTATLF